MENDQLELIRRIASVVGHELRNPLAVINNSAYFVKTKLGAGAKLDPKVKKHLEIIASEVTRADRMIADILAFSRDLELKPAAVCLDAVAKKFLEDKVFPDNIKLKKKLASAEKKINADTASLENVLARSVDNAIAAMPDGGNLTIETEVSEGLVILRVRDTGPGFKPEQAQAIFEPFFTTRPRG